MSAQQGCIVTEFGLKYSLRNKRKKEVKSKGELRSSGLLYTARAQFPRERNFKYGREERRGEVEHHFVRRFPGFARSSFSQEQYDKWPRDFYLSLMPKRIIWELNLINFYFTSYEAQRRASGHARLYRAVNTLLLHCNGKPFNDVRRVVAVHCENRTERINVLCEQIVRVWSLKAVGTYNYQCG